MTAPRPLHGFNLLPAFLASDDARFPHMFPGWDGALDPRIIDFMGRFGFSYARFPLSWLCITAPQDRNRLDERVMANLDRSLQDCIDRGIHCTVNLHEVPGYGILEPRHPWDVRLFLDAAADDYFVGLWRTLAERYAHLPVGLVSFNLLNEPPFLDGAPGRDWMSPVGRDQHAATMRRAIAAIRAVSPERIIMLDGAGIGSLPLPELEDTGAWQCCRGYAPGEITHHRADWAPGIRDVVPAWPLPDGDGGTWDIDRLRASFAPWRAAHQRGVPIICGEFGCHNRTPHAVCLAWMRDLLAVFGEMGMSWAMWNLRGSFGLLNSARTDVPYEDWHGMRLDRRMLELLIEARG